MTKKISPKWLEQRILIKFMKKQVSKTRHFVLPGVVTFGIAQGMRKAKWIKDGDLKLNL